MSRRSESYFYYSQVSNKLLSWHQIHLPRSRGWVTHAAILLALPPNQNGYRMGGPLFFLRCSARSSFVSLRAGVDSSAVEVMMCGFCSSQPGSLHLHRTAPASSPRFGIDPVGALELLVSQLLKQVSRLICANNARQWTKIRSRR